MIFDGKEREREKSCESGAKRRKRKKLLSFVPKKLVFSTHVSRLLLLLFLLLSVAVSVDRLSA